MAFLTSIGTAPVYSSCSEPAWRFKVFPKSRVVELLSSLGIIFARKSGDMFTEVTEPFLSVRFIFVSNWIWLGLMGYTIFRSLLKEGSFC